MKYTGAIVLMLLLGVVAAQDVNLFLRNKKLVKRVITCVLQQEVKTQRKYCDFIGNEIRDLVPKALKDNCAECSRQEASIANKLIDFMKKNHPKEWTIIKEMYGR